MAHRVIVPLVVAWSSDGRQVYRYAGDLLPEGLADGEVDRLLEGGFVEEVPDQVDETEPEPVDEHVEDEKPLDKLTTAQLKELAAAEGVDLSNAKTNADRVAAIAAAREAAATDTAGTSGL